MMGDISHLKLYGALTNEKRPIAAKDIPTSFSQRDRVEETSKKGSPEAKPNNNITIIRLSAYIFMDLSHFLKFFKIKILWQFYNKLMLAAKG